MHEQLSENIYEKQYLPNIRVKRMIDTMKDAYEEIKRADHLVYVSLKYTRTADVIKNIINRLILANNKMIDALTKKLSKEGKLGEEEEMTYPEKVKSLKSEYSEDEKIKEMLEFNTFLRKLDRAEFSGENEFRRHVKMKAMVDNQLYEIDLDTITSYFKRTKNYFEYCRSLIIPEESNP